jgi:peptidoglycan hydrolase-like protein with peptidoglycan-binding domain
MKMALKNPSANCFRKFKELQLTFQVVYGVISGHHPEEPTAEQILDAQARLNELGFDPGPIDGIMGPITVVAVRQY